jgi:transcriptional regulator with XRE-family HTH domain
MVITVWSGREARALRAGLRMTIEAFAQHLGVAVRTVAKWEAQGPKIVPTVGIQEVLDTALERATPAQQSRFQMLLEESSAPDERVNHAMEHPASVDLVTVARLRQRVQDLDTRYDRFPSISLLVETGQCLGQVTFLRARATTGVVRRDLHAVEAECATLMGQLVWDASQRRDNASACVYFDQAIESARLLGDRAAEGLALLRKSFVELYGRRDPKAALPLTTHTAEVTNNVSHVLTGLAVLHAAEAHAMLGDQRNCELALGRAEEQFGRVQATDPAIDLFSPAQHGRLAGSCYLFLNKAKRAQLILEETAQTLADRSKSQAIVLGNLTLACIRQRQVDEAAAMLHRALDVVEQTWGGGGLNVAFSAGRELQPWRDVPVVQEANDRLLALMGA